MWWCRRRGSAGQGSCWQAWAWTSACLVSEQPPLLQPKTCSWLCSPNWPTPFLPSQSPGQPLLSAQPPCCLISPVCLQGLVDNLCCMPQQQQPLHYCITAPLHYSPYTAFALVPPSCLGADHCPCQCQLQHTHNRTAACPERYLPC